MAVVLAAVVASPDVYADFLGGMGSVAEGMQQGARQRAEIQRMNQEAELRALEIRRMQRAEQQQRFRMQVVSNINQGAPRMLDPITRLDGARYERGALFIIYTLPSMQASQVTLDQKKAQYGLMRGKACGDSALRELMLDGDSINYMYRDQFGVTAAHFSYRSADCMQ